MLLLLTLMCYVACEVSKAQVVYSQVVPYDPRYLIRRPPVRRSAMDTLERMRLPVSRYFPQVDRQVPPAMYQPALGYPIPSDELYALPPQWGDEPSEYDTYEPSDYETEVEDDGFAPIYRPASKEILFPQQGLEKTWVEPQAQPSDANLYNDLMVNYVYGDPSLPNVDQTDLFEVQRRDQKEPGPVVMSSVEQANQNTSGKASVAVAPVEDPTSTPTTVVAMTAVPPAPAKKEVQSLVLPEPQAEMSWPDEEGQKEVPLFRPRQSSQHARWQEVQERRPARVKSGSDKTPIPMIKKMIQAGKPQMPEYDALTEELANLRKLRKH